MPSEQRSPVWNLDEMSVEEKVGQLIMVRYPDRSILERMLRDGHAGSFYFGMKGESAESVAGTLNRLQSMARYPAIVAFGSATTSCGTGLLRGLQMRIGATRSRDLAYQIAFRETTEQRAYGYHVTGSPVLDVNTNPKNPIINTRAFGDDAELVTELGTAMLQGIIDGRGVTCAMHFPGHGATIHDSHIRVPVDDRDAATIREVDWRPYRVAIAKGLLNGVCTNHVHYPAFSPGPPTPSTVCAGVVTGLLRDQLGYRGMIMSDSLTMKPMKDEYGIEESAIRAVLAGHDIILQDYQSDPAITHRALVDAVRTGRIPLPQVDAAVTRIMELKRWLGLFDTPLVDLDSIPAAVATEDNRDLAVRLARASITALEADALPLRIAAGQTCVLVTNTGTAGSGHDAETNLKHSPAAEHLFRALQARIPQAGHIGLNQALSPDEVGDATAQIREADTVIFGIFTRVVCYHEDSIGISSRHAELVQTALAAGKQTVLLDLGNPYVLSALPKAHAVLCSYDHECLESIDAIVEALFGEIPTRGKLPVTVSPTYPFGWGR